MSDEKIAAIMNEYLERSIVLSQRMSKTQLEESARVLALELARYRRMFGELPKERFPDITGAAHLTLEQRTAWTCDALKELTSTFSRILGAEQTIK